MKAIKHFILMFCSAVFLFSCDDKPKDVQQLDASTKAYFDFKNDSKYTFAEISDSTTDIVYTIKNYVNNTANPDLENNEIISYDMVSDGLPTLNIRAESGGLQFKDRIALLTKYNDTTVIGPIVFNLNENFSVGVNSGDSAVRYSTYTLGGRTYNDVVRVKPLTNYFYKEVFYAKNIGLIGRRDKNGKVYFLKSYSVNK